MKRIIFSMLGLMLALFGSLSPNFLYAEEIAMEREFSDVEIEQLLAPIALYPDSLLTHILISATYPIEVIEAERFLSKNSVLSQSELYEQAKVMEWDASIHALLAFPTVLKKLSDELSWTRRLGDAFLENEAQVLSGIQRLRQQADQAGNLQNLQNMAVTREDEHIVIEPIQREIVYVPYYDTRIVYGSWRWREYPPVYWDFPYDHHYSSHHSPFYYHSGVHIAFDFFFNAFHWHDRQVVVVRYHDSPKQRSRGRYVYDDQARHWQHKPQHRKGVAYKNRHVQEKYQRHQAIQQPGVLNRKYNNNGNDGERYQIRKSGRETAQQAEPQTERQSKQIVKNRAIAITKDEQRQRQINNKVTAKEPLMLKGEHSNTRVNQFINKENRQVKQENRAKADHVAKSDAVNVINNNQNNGKPYRKSSTKTEAQAIKQDAARSKEAIFRREDNERKYQKRVDNKHQHQR